jgi:hypothetical protein
MTMKRLILVWVMMLCLISFACADEVSFVPQGMYRVFCADGLYGMQTVNGETIIPAQYAGIQPIQDDLCLVEAEYEGKRCFGLWRLSTGEELLPCRYQWMQIAGSSVLTSEPADSEGNLGLTRIYDPENRVEVLNVADTGFDSIDYYVPQPLANGQCFVLSRLDEPGRMIAPDGTVLIDEPFSMVGDSPSCHGIVDVMSGDDGSFRFFNTGTREWLEGSYGWTYGFRDGYAAVEGEDRKQYVIDETGRVVTPPYDAIAFEGMPEYGQYGQGLFAVKQGGEWFVIRVSAESEPEVLFGPIRCSRDPLYLGDQVFALRTDSGTLVFSAADGRQLMLEGITVSDAYAEYCIVTRCEDRKGFLFTDLTVIDPVFEDCLPFLGEYGLVKIGDLWHPINRAGQVDMSVSWPQVWHSSDSAYYLAKVSTGGYLCLNPNLEPISYVCSKPDVFIR